MLCVADRAGDGLAKSNARLSQDAMPSPPVHQLCELIAHALVDDTSAAETTRKQAERHQPLA